MLGGNTPDVMRRALWWIKQDFRVSDNPALTAALAEAILEHHKTPVEGYPAPLVDRLAWSKAMKDDDYAIKKRPETRALAEQVYERHGSRRPAHTRTWKSNAPPTPRAGTTRIVKRAGS